MHTVGDLEYTGFGPMLACVGRSTQWENSGYHERTIIDVPINPRNLAAFLASPI